MMKDGLAGALGVDVSWKRGDDGRKVIFLRYREKCRSCKGTGIYVGFAERDGAGVVCYRCEGEGSREVEISFEEAGDRKDAEGIKRVFQSNPGIGIGEGPSRDGQVFRLEEFGGMPYDDWKKGLPFPQGSEMRKYTCPAWWAQSCGLPRPGFPECGFGVFSNCKEFYHKEDCWEKWDRSRNETVKT